MAEPRDPREPRIPKETAPFDADNKWTRTWIMYFESLFDLSVKEAVRQTLEVAVTHTDDLTKDLPVFGNDKADIKVGTKSGNTNKVVTNTGTNVTGNTVKWDANHNLIDAGVTPGGGGGSGTVTNTGGALTADQPVFGAGTVDVKVGTKTGNTNKLVSNTGTNVTGNTVKWDASGNLVDAGGTPGTGTVTSVALTVPAEFSVSGSPVTTSGTLAVSKATQSANTVYAGPTTGSAAAPTFRAVVPADLPLASSSAFGACKVDGTTITASSGVISAAGGGAAVYPTRATMWHDESTIVTGTAPFSYNITTPLPYGLFVFQNPPANGDTFTNSFMLASGSYTLYVQGATDANRGLVDWYVDGSVVASGQDWYSGSQVFNVIKSVSITVATSGYHVFKGVINGKNGSSTNYFLPLAKYWIKRSAD